MLRFVPLLLLAVSCGPTPERPFTPVPSNTELCGAAQTNLEKVCPKLAKTPAGKPFGVYCREAQTNNSISLNPKCLTTAANCDEADRCPQN
jgi:hypothetical protein